MGYTTDTFTGYAVNLGDTESGYRQGAAFTSGAFANKDAEYIESVVESDYPLLSVESAGDTTVECVVVVAVASTVRIVAGAGTLPSVRTSESDSEGQAQLSEFASRFDIPSVPDWISWMVRA